MTISSEDARTGPYNGNGVTTEFAYDFKVLDQSHLVVTLKNSSDVEIVQTITTHYTVAGVGDAGGGTITMVTPPASGETLTLSRAVPLTQEVDLANRGGVQPEVLETAYDKLTMITQVHQEELTRSLQIPITDPEGVNTTIPTKEARASKFVLFDANGDITVASTSTLSVSTLQAFTDYRIDTFTGDNTTVVFTLSAEPGQIANTQVYFDGVYQEKANYSLIGTALTFTTAPASGVKIEVVHGQAAATYTPDDGSITFGKLATAAVDTDLTSVSASHDTLPTALATKTYVDAQIGSNNELSEVLANGNTSGGTNIVVSAGDSITTDTIAETTAAAGVTIDGVLVKDGEVDGRDVSVDGTKLDTVETNADVTDTANVTAAGALMDSELTNITAIKALDQGVATTDTPTFAGLITAGNVDGRDVSADGTKLDGIEAGADVTDTANVTAAGALMDSELTNIAAVKALNQGVATTDSPSFAGLTATTADINGGTIDGTTIGGSSAAAGTFTTFTSTGIDDNASSTALTIDSSGNLNIGDFTPPTITGSKHVYLDGSYGIKGSATTNNGIYFARHDSESTVRRMMALAAGSNSFVIGDSDVGYVQLNVDGTARFRFDTTSFRAEDAAGPALLNEAASAANPTLIPNRVDPTTGVGWNTNQVSLVAAGNAVAIGQTTRLTASASGTWALANTAASATVPVHTFQDDGDTGMGWVSANVGALVAGGVSSMQFQADGFSIPDGVTAPSTVTGRAIIYVDSADGDLKVKFADGHVSVIAADS